MMKRKKLTKRQIDKIIAIKKSEPMRVIVDFYYPTYPEDVDGSGDARCPMCDEYVDDFANYCPNCWQRLDWSKA